MNGSLRLVGPGLPRSRARGRVVPCAVLLVSLVTACGSDGSGDGPAPTPTPAGTPTTAPSAVPTPGGVALVPPMRLQVGGADVTGYARGVSPREWIALVYVQGLTRRTRIVLPPDAGADAGPLPVAGCPLGAASPECERSGSVAMQVGESDWYFGSTPVELPSFTVSFPAVFGPAGEVELAIQCCGMSSPADSVLPLPGARFLGDLQEVEPGHPEAGIPRPILWRAPGSDFELLPLGPHADGALAYGGDATGRIVGQGAGSRPQPIVWEPTADGGFAVVTLPFAGGDSLAGARDVEDGTVVGWSGTRAVAWEPQGAGWSARVLPAAEATTACLAVAISGARVAGNCSADGRDFRAVTWLRAGDGWRVEAVLQPAPGIPQSNVHALSGDLAVGDSSQPGAGPNAGAPVAWRLPAVSQDAR